MKCYMIASNGNKHHQQVHFSPLLSVLSAMQDEREERQLEFCSI